MSSRTVATRIGHKKSRNGCVQCKARHVKCDERRPCRNCIRYCQACSLLDLGSPVSDIHITEEDVLQDKSLGNKSPAAHSRNSTSQSADLSSNAVPSHLGYSTASKSSPDEHHSDVSNPSSTALSETWLNDLMLLHYYTTSTAQTMSNSDEVRQVWKQVFPELAYKHDFLMHGILALSALHLAHNKPAESSFYWTVSVRHHTQGLESFRKLLPNIGPDNFSPAFAFSATLIICAFQRSIGGFATELDSNSVDGFVEAYHLLQGTVGIVLSMKGIWPDVGPLSRLIPHYPIQRPLPHGMQERFAKLDQLVTENCHDDSERVGCKKALSELHLAFSRTFSEPLLMDFSRSIMPWLADVPSEYITAIKQRQPIPLVILAYYGVLLHRHNSFWAFNQCGTRLVDAIVPLLEPAWAEWIQWPIERTRDTFYS